MDGATPLELLCLLLGVGFGLMLVLALLLGAKLLDARDRADGLCVENDELRDRILELELRA